MRKGDESTISRQTHAQGTEKKKTKKPKSRFFQGSTFFFAVGVGNARFSERPSFLRSLSREQAATA